MESYAYMYLLYTVLVRVAVFSLLLCWNKQNNDCTCVPLRGDAAHTSFFKFRAISSPLVLLVRVDRVASFFMEVLRALQGSPEHMHSCRSNNCGELHCIYMYLLYTVLGHSLLGRVVLFLWQNKTFQHNGNVHVTVTSGGDKESWYI